MGQHTTHFYISHISKTYTVVHLKHNSTVMTQYITMTGPGSILLELCHVYDRTDQLHANTANSVMAIHLQKGCVKPVQY